MSTTTTRMPLTQAQRLAESVLTELGPGCQRIEIAGSVRRRRPDVGDLEIVAIPKRTPTLFGDDPEGYSSLDPILAALVGTGRLVPVKSGQKYKQFLLPRHGIALDLFLCSTETWGVIFTLRIGPADFSHRLVTQRDKGGLLPSDLRVRDGRVWRRMECLETPTEQRFFDVADMKWVEPWERV